MSDEMIEIARLVSRPEALTVQAMLDAAGILCHVGGAWHASLSVEIVALGGFRLTVPRVHYADASMIVREMQRKGPAQFSEAHRRRVLHLLAVLAVLVLPPLWLAYVMDDRPQSLLEAALVPLFLLATPVAPQGSGDYYLLREGEEA